MLGKKNDRKGHPGIAFAFGALSALGACYIKNCGLCSVKNKMQSFTDAFKEGGCAMKNAMSSSSSCSDSANLD